MKKDNESNHDLKELALFDDFNQDVNEDKEDYQSNSDPDDWASYIDGCKNQPKNTLFEGMDVENEEKVKVVQDKEDNQSNSDPDDWASYIDGCKNQPKHTLFKGMDEGNEEKVKVVRFLSHQERSNEKPKDDDEKYQASTSTGRRNGQGIPTVSKSKSKNPKTSKRMVQRAI